MSSLPVITTVNGEKRLSNIYQFNVQNVTASNIKSTTVQTTNLAISGNAVVFNDNYNQNMNDNSYKL